MAARPLGCETKPLAGISSDDDDKARNGILQ
jgi:hypothetical protein